MNALFQKMQERLDQKRSRNVTSAYGTKLYVITPDTLTGWPESSVGLNLAPCAAETAAGRSSGWPLTALADTTRPLSSINTCTETAPPARTARAAGG